MQIVMHYPTDETAIKQLLKDLAAFHQEQALQYLTKLSLNERQFTLLVDRLTKEAVSQMQV